MTVSIEDIKYKANEFNKQYFDNQINLDTITFKISNRMTRTWGNCSYPDYYGVITITLSSIIFLEEWHWNQTLIHEMIHALELHRYGRASHGAFFKAWAMKINKESNGYFNISRCTAPTQKVANAVTEKRKDRLSKQYIMKKGRKLNFLRKMTAEDIDNASLSGFEVYKVLNPLPNVSHAKNYTYAVRMSSYYYDDIIQRRNLELRRIV